MKISSKRVIRRKICPKISHPTRYDAERHAEAVRREKCRFLSVYYCPRCGFWHLGRPTRADLYRRYN
jgi:hypothetical protein